MDPVKASSMVHTDIASYQKPHRDVQETTSGQLMSYLITDRHAT